MKFRKILSLLLLCMLLMNFQCDDDDTVVIPCGLEVITDSTTYESSETSYFGVLNVSLNNDCLMVHITSSGCDASSWELTLIDSENIAESMPPQRYMKLTLYNNEACLAVFEKEETFDLTSLQVEGTNEVVLNIEGLPDSVLYTY
ncbi:hypothetical protein [Winogradskyella helgolandensis]|uniref:hypothetical protein n=1 Tax=Winogradskyella helgolandensis TaxID=2697010 RepID=UPI0015C74FFD|nr:hypothetical protein [Winogradskyella helgolandensis]